MTLTRTCPLHIDELLENNEDFRLKNRILRWLKKFFPIVTGPPRGRKSIEMQLSMRTRFPRELWKKFGPEKEVLEILEIIERELKWPNHNFIPEDPLTLAVDLGLDSFDRFYAISEIEKKYEIKYLQEDIERAIEEKWTICHFVQDVLRRSGVS